MYNSLSALPKGEYNILVYLATKNENIWKMLKYNSYDALSKPNLTFDEKLDFIWKTGKMEDYSVFLTNLVGDAICESKCVFKCYQYYIHAKPNSFNSTVVYAFDFLFGDEMALVEYEGVPVNRGNLFIHEILSTVNGVDIGGVGKLVFNDDISRYVGGKSVISNAKTFTGACLFMGTMMGDTGEEADCGS